MNNPSEYRQATGSRRADFCMVVQYRCSYHLIGPHGTRRRSRSVVRHPLWRNRRLSDVCNHDIGRRVVGGVPSPDYESPSIVRRCDLTAGAASRYKRRISFCVDSRMITRLRTLHALLEVQRVHDGGAALYAAQPASLRQVPQLWVLVGSGRPVTLLS